MAYTAIDTALVRAGKSLVYTLFDLVRTNFIDHETRIGAVEGVTIDIPVGIVVPKVNENLPSDSWKLCDGTALSRSTYATLFAALGTAHGTGDGSTTFNLPDLRGRTPIGAGTGSGLTARTLGQAIGEESHQLTSAEMTSHTHGVNDPKHHHYFSPAYSGAGASTGFRTTTSLDGAFASITHPFADSGISADNAGSDTPHNTMAPSLVCAFMIKVL